MQIYVGHAEILRSDPDDNACCFTSRDAEDGKKLKLDPFQPVIDAILQDRASTIKRHPDHKSTFARKTMLSHLNAGGRPPLKKRELMW